MEPPLHASRGGAHVHFGNCVYPNFSLTAVDDTHIHVGDHTIAERYNQATGHQQTG